MWGIPLASVAGVLAVTYTGNREADVGAPEESPPVQRPGSAPKPPVLPPAPTEDADSDAADDDAADAPSEPDDLAPADDATPAQPEVPALPPATDPQPLPEAPSAAPRRSAPMERGHDDEPAPASQPQPARSQQLLRPTDRRGFFSMSVGGATGTSYYSSYFPGMDFQWQMAIGAHARRFPTFGGGFVVQQRKGFLNEFTFAGRLQWDQPISDAFAIYSSFNFDLGVNLIIGYGSYLGFGGASALLGVGWSVKAILAERLLLGLRPISPNLIVPSQYSPIFVSVRWDVLASIGLVW